MISTSCVEKISKMYDSIVWREVELYALWSNHNVVMGVEGEMVTLLSKIA